MTTPFGNNIPDRVVILPGRIALVEVKAPGRKPRPGQEREMGRLKELGCEVGVVDSYEAVERLLERGR